MIFAIEGNVNLGKTTYINEFIKENTDFVKVDEIPFKKDLSHYDRQIYYIDEERNKKKFIHNHKNLFLDRTILSTLAYTIYGEYLSKDEKKDLIKIIIHHIKLNSFVEPEKIFYITNYDNDEIRNMHNILKSTKHTMDILTTDDFISFFDQIFFHWLSFCKFDSELKFNNRTILIYKTKNLFNKIASELETFV